MFADLIYRLRALFRRKTVETEMDEELCFHFERQVEKYLASGMTREEARRQARLQFGGLEQVKEDCRDSRGVNFIETVMQDIRYGLRILGRTPVVTAVAILSLALGIGANTAIFGLIDKVMLRMLPVQKPEELVQIRNRRPQSQGPANTGFTNALWEQVRDQQDVFSGVAAWGEDRFDLATGGAVRYANGIWASGDFFKTLGLQPAAGRLLNRDDDRRGCPAVAVLSYGFWQEHFGGADSAMGTTLPLNRYPFQVIGVTPRGFHGLNVGTKFDVAVPVCASEVFDGKESRLDHRSWWWLEVIGRVRPGVSPEQLKARLHVLSPSVFAAALPQDWDEKYQQVFRKRTLEFTPAPTGVSDVRRQFGQPLLILMTIVGLVLLIACANIASLMLARAAAREREIAMRKALGASRMRLIRQLLTECVLLSSGGAVLGVFFARWGNELLVRYLSTARNAVFLDLSLDGRILAFTATIAVLTGILFGILPAFRSTRISLSSAMKGAQAMEGEGRVRFRPGKWIVASQVALSLVLLVGAGLFLRSLVKLASLDIGFDRSNILVVSTNLKNTKMPQEQYLATYEDVAARLRALPGAISVARCIRTPISNFQWNQLIQADTPNAPKGDDALVYFNFISPGYFSTLRTPILAGRDLDQGDTKTSPMVAIINEAVARKFYPNVNPIGRVFRVDQGPKKPAWAVQIVGLARDSKYESLREETYPQAFFPVTQIPEHNDPENFLLRTATPPAAFVSAVQEAIAGVNKEISLRFTTLAEQVDDSLIQERLLATLSGFFGGLALLLAMIGLYGALSYLVTQRQAEFGIRRALGAQPGSILRLVMRDVAAVLTGGVAAGVCISLLAVRLLQKMLFGLAPHDAVTLVAAVCLLSAVAFFAGYFPARRAMRTDPMAALRYE